MRKGVIHISNFELYNGDCLQVMDKLIEDGVKVDMILCDPPYGTTRCKWDSVIPFDDMWERANEITQFKTPIVIFGSEPFTSELIHSNIKNFKYNWIWQKEQGSGFLNAKRMPLKDYEAISVFYKKQCTYNPQMKNTGKGWRSGSSRNFEGYNEFTHSSGKIDSSGLRYPKSILKFNKETGFHPTQKPICLLEYLIKTYTNEGDTILDFTMGSGSTGVACRNTNRNFIGIELDEKYFKIAQERIGV